MWYSVSLSLISEQLFKSPRWNQIRVERWTMIDSLNDERSEWRHTDSAIWSELSRAPNQFRILLSSLQAVNDAWWWLLWLHLALGHRVTWAQWGCATLGFYRTALVYPPCWCIRHGIRVILSKYFTHDLRVIKSTIYRTRSKNTRHAAEFKHPPRPCNMVPCITMAYTAGKVLV